MNKIMDFQTILHYDRNQHCPHSAYLQNSSGKSYGTQIRWKAKSAGIGHCPYYWQTVFLVIFMKNPQTLL
jgi:hypothetical protein